VYAAGFQNFPGEQSWGGFFDRLAERLAEGA
jgi:hypothetical protein